MRFTPPTPPPFDIPDEPDPSDSTRFFVHVWAGYVMDHAPLVAALREKLYDHDPEDERSSHERFCRMWSAQHLLVVAAHQLHLWRKRLAEETGTEPPDEIEDLAYLRHALEHANEAGLSGLYLAPPGRSIKELDKRGKRVPLFVLRTAGRDLFDIVDTALLIRAALAALPDEPDDEYLTELYAEQ